MKKILLLLFAVSSILSAQESNIHKFGYCNVDYVLSYMPERETVQKQLSDYQTQLQTELQKKYKTLQDKVTEYQKNEATYLDIVRNDKEREIQDFRTSIQKFKMQSEQAIAQKRADLLQPLYDKIQDAIKSVAKERGFTHVFNPGALLYAPESEDIAIFVLDKLGISAVVKKSAQKK